MTFNRMVALVGGVLAILVAFIMLVRSVCDVDAGEIVVRQSLGGELTVWSDPGWHWQGLGSVTRYARSEQYVFKAPDPAKKLAEGEAPDPDNSLHVRFGDQGGGRLSGSASFDLPTDEERMVELHKQFRSPEGIRRRLIEPALSRAVYNSGPLMSSRESAGSRRSDLIRFIQEQATNGAYKTIPKETEAEDYLAPPLKTIVMVDVPVLDAEQKPMLDDKGAPILKKEPQQIEKPATKRIVVNEIALDAKGQAIVQEKSPIAVYGIKIYNITVDRILYEQKVQEQIDRQRDMEMAIQTKISEAKQAEQDVVTTEKKGQAAAAAAKWEQEVKKAQAMTEAQQQKEVAVLQAMQRREVAERDLDAAKLERQASVERAKGESESKRLIIEADGALQQKLAAYVDVQKAWAEQAGKQRWVPDVVMGGDARGSNAAVDFMSLLQAKAAKDLSLNPSVNR